MHVLLIEDDHLIAEGIVAGLGVQGFTVDHMDTVAAAEQALELATFDALILDVGLPDEDGLVFLERQRKQGMSLPVLILSYVYAQRFTVAGMGEDFAKNLGLSYKSIVNLGLILVALVSTTVVLTVGMIPFLGLIIPNIVSIFKGDNSFSKNSFAFNVFSFIA